jgi:hypothetical protein
MKRPNRHSGRPAATRFSQASAIISADPRDDLAPSINQLMMRWSSEFSMGAFADEVVGQSSCAVG